MDQPAWRAIGATLTALASALLVACSSGGGAAQSPPTPSAAAPSPSADATAQKYVAIIHDYWASYESAKGGWDTYCYFGPINTQMCGVRSQAILVVDQDFLTQLQAATPPPQFANDHQILLGQMPKVIVAVKAMITASATGDDSATHAASGDYVNTMIPIVVTALDRIDPRVPHT